MNIDEYLSTHLKDGERLVRTVKQHYAVLLPATVFGGFLIIVNFFLLTWWFAHHGWGVLGFLVVLIVASLWVIRSIYLWQNNILLITTSRVIDLDQRGFFERRAIEASFDKIQDIRYVVRGVWSTMFRFGTISLFTAGKSEPLDLDFVAQPADVQRQLADLQQHYSGQAGGPLSANELVAMVDQLKSQLGPEELNQLLKRHPSEHGPTRKK